MPFNAKEKEIIKWGVQNGKRRDEIESAIIRFRETGSARDPNAVVATPQEPNAIERVGGVIERQGTQVLDAIQGVGEFEGQTPLRRGFEAAAEAAKAVVGVPLAAAPSPIRSGVGVLGDLFKRGFNAVTGKIAETDLFREIGELEQSGALTKETAPQLFRLREGLGVAESAGEIADVALLAQGTATGLDRSLTFTKNLTTKTVDRILASADDIAKNKIPDVRKSLTPDITDSTAAGQAVPSATSPDDIKKVIETVNSIDVSEVKTYQNFLDRIDDGIKSTVSRVDDVLDQNPNPVQIDDLAQTINTAQGPQSVNWVQRGLDDLAEAFSQTDDIKNLAFINSLRQKVNAGTGLTPKEVNQLARLHGRSFRSFTVGGELKQTRGAARYENVRAGLKSTARELVDGDEAKLLDARIHAMIDTNRMVERLRNQVSRLQNRTRQLGAVEQVAEKVGDLANVFSGGLLRGLGKRLFLGSRRGVLNVLDLQERLQKNLQIIQAANNAQTPAQMTRLLNRLDDLTDIRTDIPTSITPQSVARNIDIADRNLIAQFLDSPDTINLPVLELLDNIGIGNADVAVQHRFLREVLDLSSL